jgi:hypothetical protein
MKLVIFRFYKVYLQNSIAEYIWKYFIQMQKKDIDKAVEALKLLCLVLEANPKFIKENMENFSQVLLSIIKMEPSEINWRVIGQLAKAFHYLNDFKMVQMDNVKGLRCLYLKGLLQLMFSHQGTKDHAYCNAMEKIIHLCFVYRSHPESVCEFILKTMASFLGEEKSLDGKGD